MSDFRVSKNTVAVALHSRKLAALAAGPQAIYQLAQACREFARDLDEMRDAMPASGVEWHCSHCGRYWTANLTIAEDRAMTWGPDICPECFDALKASEGSSVRSGWHAKGFHYLAPERGA